jgi:hypothetical protein
MFVSLKMLLVQIAFYVIGCIPFGIWAAYVVVTAKIIKSYERQAIEGLVNTIMYLLINSTFADRYERIEKYLYLSIICSFASSFYLFCATSKSFRKQFKAACQPILDRLRGYEHAQIRPTTASVIQTGV